MALTQSRQYGASDSRSALSTLKPWQHDFEARTRSIYGPLNSDRKEFRILEVDAGSEEDTLKCSLRLASLTNIECQAYETISYCWGDPTLLADVDINDTRAQVPSSCVQALKRMRHPSHGRVLWIDAICIDQANLDERSEQVALMKEIYNKSAGNLVYLGEADEWTSSAFRSINLIMAEIDEEFSSFADFRDAFLPDRGGYMSEQRSQSGYTSELDFFALESIFCRSFFRRLWVVPETLVAPSNQCHCGMYELPLLTILRASTWLRYKFDHIGLSTKVSFCGNPLLRWWQGIDPVQFKGRQRPSTFFETPAALYQFASSREATDERDRVFALAGLLSCEVPQAFVSNYRKPVSEVLRDASRHYFFTDGKLDCHILSRAIHNAPADFDSDYYLSWMPNDYDGRITPQPIRRIFRAHGDSSAHYRLSTREADAFWNPMHDDELILPGFLADTIERCTSALSER